MNVLKTFFRFFRFNQDTLQARMELYIQSKRPTSVADVDRIMNEYHRYIQRGGMYS